MIKPKPLQAFSKASLTRFFSRKGHRKTLALIVLLILMLPALQPLLRNDFTCGYDTIFHLYRAVQVDALWSQGVFASRWAPDMAHGYGFPLFIFTSPAPSMIVTLLHRVGLSWAFALNGTFALGMVLGGLFMFLLAEDLFGSFAGLVAGVAYVYAPFQAYDVFNRGSLWESFAWAFPPLVLWGLHRWGVRRQIKGLILGVIGLSLMVMSHHLFAFLFAPLLTVWVLMSAVLRRDWRILWRGVLLGVLGMGLTTFFWIPPLLERPYVQTARLLGTWVFDWRYNFLSLRHLLAQPRFADAMLINDWPEKALGMVPVLLSLLSIVGWKKKERQRRWHTGALMLLTVGYSVLTLPVSKSIWDSVPLLTYVQFPWRFLGPASFCIALLLGAACTSVLKILRLPVHGSWVAMLFSGVLVFANLGWFYPQHCAAPDDISLQAMLRWEHLTDTLGTTAKGEYLPVWVKTMPSSAFLEDAYANDETIRRIDPASLPVGSTILEARYGAVRDRIQINAATAFRCELLRFYYPGWQVKIDGQKVPVVPDAETGLITFDVPVGQHSIEASFVETPARLAADGVSIAAALAFAVVIVISRRGTRATESTPANKSNPAILIIFALAVFLVKIIHADWVESPWQRTRLRGDGTVARTDLPTQANFGNRAMLLGADGLLASLAGDDSPEITLYWRALNPGDADWQVGLSLVGAEGETRHTIGMRPARWARTPPPLGEWEQDKYARMDFILDFPPGIPPGQYDLTVKLFDRDTLLPASVLGAGGNPLGPELTIQGLTVHAPDIPYSLSVLGVPDTAQPVTCGPLRLWWIEADRTTAAPGDVVVVRRVWEAAEQPEGDYSIPLALVDDQGDVLLMWDLPLVASWWPTGLWQAGDRWVGTLGARIPGSVESGHYTIRVGQRLCDAPMHVPVEVIAPERLWAVPPGYTPMDATLGAVVALKGYQLEAKTMQLGDILDLSLAWEAPVQMDVSYRVFVHLTGEDGRLLAQNDGEPAGWTRPTTGWAVGEIVVDNRPLTIPSDAEPGSYTLTTGVYLEDGARLMLPDGGDTILIAMIVVE